MSKKTITEIPDQKGDTIKLILERKYYRPKDEKGKKAPKEDKEGKKQYKVHDLYALIEVLNRFDSRAHEMREWQSWSGVTTKITSIQEDMTNSEGDLELEIEKEEAKFLRRYIEEFNQKDGKQQQPLSPIAIVGLPKILDQLQNA